MRIARDGWAAEIVGEIPAQEGILLPYLQGILKAMVSARKVSLLQCQHRAVIEHGRHVFHQREKQVLACVYHDAKQGGNQEHIDYLLGLERIIHQQYHRKPNKRSSTARLQHDEGTHPEEKQAPILVHFLHVVIRIQGYQAQRHAAVSEGNRIERHATRQSAIRRNQRFIRVHSSPKQQGGVEYEVKHGYRD